MILYELNCIVGSINNEVKGKPTARDLKCKSLSIYIFWLKKSLLIINIFLHSTRYMSSLMLVRLILQSSIYQLPILDTVIGFACKSISVYSDVKEMLASDGKCPSRALLLCEREKILLVQYFSPLSLRRVVTI